MKAIRIFPALLALAMFVGTGDAVAATGKDTNSKIPDVSIASAPAKFDIHVNARCRGRIAEVRLVNKGDRWPELGEFKIIRISDNSLITERRLIMGKNQRASFRLQGTFHRGDEIGVFIDPSWTDRKFKYDSRITCR